MYRCISEKKKRNKFSSKFGRGKNLRNDFYSAVNLIASEVKFFANKRGRQLFKQWFRYPKVN